jgi:hypothetical protein
MVSSNRYPLRKAASSLILCCFVVEFSAPGGWTGRKTRGPNNVAKEALHQLAIPNGCGQESDSASNMDSSGGSMFFRGGPEQTAEVNAPRVAKRKTGPGRWLGPEAILSMRFSGRSEPQ